MGSEVDLVTLSGTLSLVTMVVVQLIKPAVERIPHIDEEGNKALHDNILRALQYGLNFGLLLLAAHNAPAAFAGFQWYDLLSEAFGQSVVSHVAYKSVAK